MHQQQHDLTSFAENCHTVTAQKMPKICCIVNCHNQSNSDCNERKLFLVPKDEERRRKWLDVISPYLREGRKSRKLLYVCDLHFIEDDIRRNTSILLKDGSTDTISCLHVKLKPSSIPCIFDVKHRILPNTDSPAVKNERRNIPTPEGEQETKFAPEDEGGAEASHPKREKESKLVPKEEKESAYDLKILEKELRGLWEKTKNRVWGSFIISCGLMISYFGENPRVATKTILVKEDMSVEIRASGKIFMNDFKDKIKSVDDVVSVMKEVQRKHLCQGSDNSTPCPYDYFESSTIPSSGRCISCRIERKRRLNNLSRLQKRSSLKKIEEKRLIKNLKRRNERLVKNLASAKEKIEELKAQCASSSDAAIEKAMKHFPSAQREAVKASLAAARCKGPTGIRYSQPWILECIRLRMKSRRAYRHVLSHQILQAPTIDTLDKYLEKTEPSHGFEAETLEKKVLETVGDG